VMEPCLPGNSGALVVFVVLALVSHARGTVLLLREGLALCRRLTRFARAYRKRKSPPHL